MAPIVLGRVSAISNYVDEGYPADSLVCEFLPSPGL